MDKATPWGSGAAKNDEWKLKFSQRSDPARIHNCTNPNKVNPLDTPGSEVSVVPLCGLAVWCWEWGRGDGYHPWSVWTADRSLPPQGEEKPKQTPSKKLDRRVSNPVPYIKTTLAPLAISCIIGELAVLVLTKTSRDAAPDKFGQIDNADLWCRSGYRMKRAQQSQPLCSEHLSISSCWPHHPPLGGTGQLQHG